MSTSVLEDIKYWNDSEGKESKGWSMCVNGGVMTCPDITYTRGVFLNNIIVKDGEVISGNIELYLNPVIYGGGSRAPEYIGKPIYVDFINPEKSEVYDRFYNRETGVWYSDTATIEEVIKCAPDIVMYVSKSAYRHDVIDSWVGFHYPSTIQKMRDERGFADKFVSTYGNLVK